MTAIVGLVDKKAGITVMGGDSAGAENYEITSRKDPKVFMNGPFLIGGSGSFREVQVLRHVFEPPFIGTDNVYSYMVRDFIEAMRVCMSNAGATMREDGADRMRGDFLVAYGDQLFFIDGDFQVGEFDSDYAAVGVGREYAMGSLFSTSKKKSAVSRVGKALDAAVEFNGGVRPPFTIETLLH